MNPMELVMKIIDHEELAPATVIELWRKYSSKMGKAWYSILERPGLIFKRLRSHLFDGIAWKRTRKQSKMQSHQDDIEERVEEDSAVSAIPRGSLARGSIWTLRAAIQHMPELAGALIHEVLQASTGRESLKPSEEPTAQSPTEITNPESKNKFHAFCVHIFMKMQSHGSSQQGSAYGTSQPPPKSQFDDEEQQILSNLPWIKVRLLQLELGCTESFKRVKIKPRGVRRSRLRDAPPHSTSFQDRSGGSNAFVAYTMTCGGQLMFKLVLLSSRTSPVPIK
ncbi:unnamed protein product [Haemonchus placei]|uniref:Fork-head domain-containing protein n=1 Tax=Haemonchus placei TaxID=6290 RepID=A0A0N4WGY5_HAEPC|nr:unnamed protein product [Haemonchus placei]